MASRLTKKQPPKRKKRKVPVALKDEEFIPDEIPEQIPITIEVMSELDKGKTHFARTFKNPLFLDTENKAFIVLKKFDPVPWKRVKTFNDIRLGVEWAIDNSDIDTVVIDSGSDVRALAEQEWCNEQGKEKIWPRVLWAQVYEKIDWIPIDLTEAGKNLVVTCRMKDEWIADTTTGRRIRDDYKKWPWALEMGIEIVNGIRERDKVHFKDRKFGKVTKNNFHGIDQETMLNYQKPYIFDVSYNGVINEMVEPWGDGIKVGNELAEIIKQAEEYIILQG